METRRIKLALLLLTGGVALAVARQLRSVPHSTEPSQPDAATTVNSSTQVAVSSKELDSSSSPWTILGAYPYDVILDQNTVTSGDGWRVRIDEYTYAATGVTVRHGHHDDGHHHDGHAHVRAPNETRAYFHTQPAARHVNAPFHVDDTFNLLSFLDVRSNVTLPDTPKQVPHVTIHTRLVVWDDARGSSVAPPSKDNIADDGPDRWSGYGDEANLTRLGTADVLIEAYFTTLDTHALDAFVVELVGVPDNVVVVGDSGYRVEFKGLCVDVNQHPAQATYKLGEKVPISSILIKQLDGGFDKSVWHGGATHPHGRSDTGIRVLGVVAAVTRV